MYDVIIVGAGPGGLTSAIYTARANMKTLILEKGIYGGQMQQTEEVENFPAFKTIKGYELSQYMYDQAIHLGTEYKNGEVKDIIDKGDYKIVKTSSGDYETKSVILGTGASPRKLVVKGETKFSGKGVSYCAICDGAFFKNKEVVVIGGGDSALEEAHFLTKFAKKVTIIHRRDKFRAQPVLQDRVFNSDKIEIIYDSVILEINGDDKVSGVTVKDLKTEVIHNLSTDGVFIYIGLVPNTNGFEDLGILNEAGYIVTDENMATRIPGVFAIGDVRDKKLRQIVTATGDGSSAAVEAQHYVESLND